GTPANGEWPARCASVLAPNGRHGDDTKLAHEGRLEPPPRQSSPKEEARPTNGDGGENRTRLLSIEMSGPSHRLFPVFALRYSAPRGWLGLPLHPAFHHPWETEQAFRYL